MRKKLGRILPWVVTLGLLFYVFRSISFSEILAAFATAAPWTVPVLMACVLGVYLGDSFAIWKTFGWFVTRLSFREVLVVRGATYLLALVNYSVGQGAIVYFVNRSRGIPLLRGTAAVLLVMGTNILLLLVFATIGLLVAPDLPPALRKIVFGAYAALAVYAVLLLLKPRWLTSRPVFDVLFAAGVSGHLRALLVRIPHIGILMVFTFASLRAFGVQVPAAQAVTVQLIGPFAPKRIETWPAARFARTAGMVNGDIFRGPPWKIASFSFSMVASPPMAEPMITPVRSALSSPMTRPASVMAISAAASA